jgi:hypothetical protein
MMAISSSLMTIATLLKISTDKERIPEMLRALADYLKEEPDENFIHGTFNSYTSEGKIDLPLTLNDSALKSLETKISEFPDIIRSGKAGIPQFNFIYMLGQLLANIAMIFESHHVMKKTIIPHVDEFFKLWGSFHQMNGLSLSQKYRDKSNSAAKQDLISKLNESAKIIETNILPVLKSEKK